MGPKHQDTIVPVSEELQWVGVALKEIILSSASTESRISSHQGVDWEQGKSFIANTENSISAHARKRVQGDGRQTRICE